MDADLLSIAAARRSAESAFEAYQKFLGTNPKHVDDIVRVSNGGVAHFVANQKVIIVRDDAGLLNKSLTNE